MKALFSTIFLWAVIFMTIAQGQERNWNQRLDDYTQNLNVYHQGELVAVVSGQSIHDLREDGRWRNLLVSFKENLKSIQSNIPEYLIYKIDYQKDYNLIVEEVEGIVRYKVNDSQTIFDSKQSVAILKDQDYSMQLNFGKLEDLFSTDYEMMIESAMNKLGEKPGSLSRAYFPKFNYDYSYSKQTMIEKKEKVKTKLVLPINATVGVFKARPIYESGLGIGILVKKENDVRSNLFYVYSGTLFQYLSLIHI